MSRPLLPIKQYVEGILAGDRVVLGQAITLIESTNAEHRLMAQQVIAQLLENQSVSADKPSLRIAITGAPGVGKSTFIEALGMYLVAQGLKVAVLAIDPSSSISGGSILGDKTRMEQLSTHPAAYIRPSPAGDSLGGVARKTRETIVLVEAAGYDIILLETVGVGQSEIAARSMTDLFVLLLLPGAGDELQGIKRGIVEMADLLVVNKADGDRAAWANQARVYYQNATHLLPAAPSGWAPQTLTCSAVEKKGIDTVWAAVQDYATLTRNNHYFEENRHQQARYWLQESLEEGLKRAFYADPAVQEALKNVEQQVLAGTISPFAAGEEVLAAFFK